MVTILLLKEKLNVKHKTGSKCVTAGRTNHPGCRPVHFLFSPLLFPDKCCWGAVVHASGTIFFTVMSEPTQITPTGRPPCSWWLVHMTGGPQDRLEFMHRTNGDKIYIPVVSAVSSGVALLPHCWKHRQVSWFEGGRSAGAVIHVVLKI